MTTITKWSGSWVEFDTKAFCPLRNLSKKEIQQYKKKMIQDWLQRRIQQRAIEAVYISSAEYDFAIQLHFY